MNSGINLELYKSFETLRKEQQIVIPEIIESFKNKKFFILEAPPGCGKSAFSTTIGNYYASNYTFNEKYNCGTYIVVHQKILQDQYINEKWFKIINDNNEINNIKSSNNYYCDRLSSLGVTCGEVSKYRRNDKEVCEFFNCKYFLEKTKFFKGKIGVTNIQYFLHLSAYMSKLLAKKELLIIDEAHTLESSLLQFISIEISEWISNIKLKIQFPKNLNDEKLIEWINKTYIQKIISLISDLRNNIEKLIKKTNLNIEEKAALKSHSEDLEYWDKHLSKLKSTLEDYHPDTWIIDKTISKSGYHIFSFKPIIIDKYANKLVFDKGEKILLMSATILNKSSFCKSLGIKEDEAEFITLPSSFKKENRMIHYDPVGKMGRSDINDTLPKMAKKIDNIMKDYPNSKGIIHCNSYQIVNYLLNNIPKESSKRFLTHTSLDRDKILNKHFETKKPTVLLTPSMAEGVDLKDDYSRFQILAKIPFPYLGDKRVMLKKKLQPWWYPYSTARIVIQGLGRSIRNENDFADSFILDENWDFFFRINKALFPKWFIESIKN